MFCYNLVDKFGKSKNQKITDKRKKRTKQDGNV